MQAVETRRLDADYYFGLYHDYGIPLYDMIPGVIIERSKGPLLYDLEGREFIDMLACYSAVNQGHCHPYIVGAHCEQAQKNTLVSQSIGNPLAGPLLQKITGLLGYEKAILANSGAEAVETALKTMRAWGERVKEIPAEESIIVVCNGNFHGRTTTIISFSDDPTARGSFGPFTPGFLNIPYDDIPALRTALRNKKVVGFIFEPIQGEAGIRIPKPGYLKAIRQLCTDNNVLMVADEIQTGLGRTGEMLACYHEQVFPDMITIGKALSGGIYPVSAVVGLADVLGVFKPGEHGSTYGGNPLACATALAALEVLEQNNFELCRRAIPLGKFFRALLSEIESDLIKEVRGIGLMTALVLDNEKVNPWQFCIALSKHGVLAKPAHDIIRLTPTLDISQKQLGTVAYTIKETLNEF